MRDAVRRYRAQQGTIGHNREVGLVRTLYIWLFAAQLVLFAALIIIKILFLNYDIFGFDGCLDTQYVLANIDNFHAIRSYVDPKNYCPSYFLLLESFKPLHFFVAFLITIFSYLVTLIGNSKYKDKPLVFEFRFWPFITSIFVFLLLFRCSYVYDMYFHHMVIFISSKIDEAVLSLMHSFSIDDQEKVNAILDALAGRCWYERQYLNIYFSFLAYLLSISMIVSIGTVYYPYEFLRKFSGIKKHAVELSVSILLGVALLLIIFLMLYLIFPQEAINSTLSAMGIRLPI